MPGRGIVEFAEVGEGNLDWTGLIDQSIASGADHLFVEPDNQSCVLGPRTAGPPRTSTSSTWATHRSSDSPRGSLGRSPSLDAECAFGGPRWMFRSLVPVPGVPGCQRFC